MSRRGSGARPAYQISTWHAAQPQQTTSPQHKVILLGMAGVGKTAFFLRVRDSVFREPQSTCVPADYLFKTISVPTTHGDNCLPIKIILYDTAGGEKFRSLTSNFFKNAHAAVLMFSMNDAVSFYKMELEVQNAGHFIGGNFVWVVVGNKSDLSRDPIITEERVETFCAGLGSREWVYMSVKTGERVEEVLELVAGQLYKRHHQELYQSEGYTDTVQLVTVEGEGERGGSEGVKKTCRTHIKSCGT